MKAIIALFAATPALYVLAHSVPVSAADYVYAGPIISDVSGATCRPASTTQEQNYVFRDLFAGLTVSNSYPGMPMNVLCALSRRNTSIYGVSAASIDRVLMTSLRINLPDYSMVTGYGEKICQNSAPCHL